MKNNKNLIIPIAFIGMMFFAIGFALGINSFLIPVLNKTLEISSGQSYLILAATFSTFIIFGYPASRTIAAIGYKKTMALSFVLFAFAFLLFIPSAKYESFTLFLVASFMSGIGNTFLQASVNPYITILGPMESAAKRMSIMGICNKLAWPVSPIFLAYVIGKNTDDTVISDLFLPFYIIIGVFLLLGVISLLAPLPEVKAAGEDEEEDTKDSGKSILDFPHLLLGALALFFYVGVETVALGTLVDYASWLSLPNASSYALISPIGMVVGYICGILFIPKYISQSKALIICSILGIVGSLLVVFTPANISIWFIALVALGCSLMWPALWPLAISDLGKFTKTGSSFLVMAIAGGAVIPVIYGFMKDVVGAQNSYWIAPPLFIYILYYGLKGHKIRKNRAK